MNSLLGPKHPKAFRNNYLAALGATVFLLLSFVADAQVFPPPSTNYAGRDNRREVDSALYGPTGCGVPLDSTWLFSKGFGNGEKPKKFAIYFDTCGHHLYVWDPAPRAWHIVDSSSGGGGTDSAIAKGYGIMAITISGTTRYIAVDTNLITSILSRKKLADSIGGILATKLTATPGDTANKWVGSISNNATNDSIIFYIGGTRHAIKDNGSGGGPDSAVNAGTYTKKSVSGTTITIDLDTTKVPIDTFMTRITGVTGVAPMTTYIAGRVTALNFPKFRDTSAASIQYTPDSALAIPTHDSTSANGFVTRFDGDSAKVILRTSIAGKEPAIAAPNTTNKYWNGYKAFVPLNTDSISEGTANKFFTNARAQAALAGDAPILYNTGTGHIGIDTSAGNAHVATQYQVSLKQNQLISGNGTTLNSNKIDLGGTKTATSILVGNALMRTQHIENFQVGDTSAILGQIFQDNFARSSLGSNWSASAGDQVITFPGSGFMRVQSTLNGFGDYIKMSAISGVNSDTTQLDFVVDTIGATTYGPGIGFIDAAGFPTGYICQYGTASGGLMKIFLRYYDGSTVLATSTNAVTMSVGDTMRAQFIRQDDQLKTYYYNRTVGGTDSCSKAFTFTRLASDPTTPGTGFRAIYFLGGKQDIFNYRVASPEPKYVTGVGANSIGDAGYNATVLTNSWPYFVFPSRGLFAKIGGSGDRASDQLSDTAVIRTLGLKYMLDAVGINDALNNTNLATFSTSKQAWVNYCIAVGCTPILIELTPGKALTPSKAYSDTMRAIVARTPGAIMINGIYDAFRTGTVMNGIWSTDSVHFNDAGHALYASIVKAALPAGALQIYNFTARNLPPAVISAKLATLDSAGNMGVGPLLSTIQIIGNPVRVGTQLLMPNSTIPALSLSRDNGTGFMGIWQNLNAGGWSGPAFYSSSGTLKFAYGHANPGTTNGNGNIADSCFIFKTFDGTTQRILFFAGANQSTSANADASIFRGGFLPSYHTSSGRTVNPIQGTYYWDTDSLDYVNYTTANGWKKWWRNSGLSTGGGGSPPFADNTAIAMNNSDNTKLLKFDLSGFTTATTRTWTFPNASGTVARSDAAQTFTGPQTFGDQVKATAGLAVSGWQLISSGSSGTVSANISNVLFNPVSLLSSYTLTLPAAPNDGQIIDIFFGGSIGANTAVVTTLSIIANGGQTILEKTPLTSAVGGDHVAYIYYNSTGTWYRKF